EDDNNNEQDSSGEESDQENDGDDDKTQSDNENESNSEHETDENKSGFESDQEENEEDIGDDEEEVKDEFVKTLSNNSDEAKITDKSEGDEDEEIDYTTSQLYDDVDIRLNEPIDTDKGFIQEEGTNAEITNKIEVPVTSSSHSSDMTSKFLNFSDIPHIDAEINSPMDVHMHHEVPSQVIALEKEVAKLKKDPLHTQVTALVDDHLDARLGATRNEFMNYLSASITVRITKQVKIQLPQILPKEVSNFAPP
ncbi:hypothetical protein Tco_1205021, partial [Tanacetum coccineum]